MGDITTIALCKYASANYVKKKKKKIIDQL